MRIILKTLAITALLMTVAITANGADRDTFEFDAGGVRWTVKLGQVESYDADEAASALTVSSNSEDQGSVKSSWDYDETGDLGPMWTIENEDGEVMGACWSYSEDHLETWPEEKRGLECTPLYAPATLMLEPVIVGGPE